MSKIRNYNKPVRVTQSLTPYLRGVKKDITTACKNLIPDNLIVRFIHLKSATSGLHVKLVDKTHGADKDSWVHFNGIWCLSDFTDQVAEKFKAST